MRGLRRYLDVLAAGGVVACPTETLVGLLADALREDAVSRVVALKGRSPDAPIAVLLPDADALSQVAMEVPDAAMGLARRHWPGPLTIVARARPGLPAPLIRDGKVGARVPGPSPALELVRAFGRPLTATSANRSGVPAAHDDAGLREALGDAVDLIDAIVPGKAPGGPPSTVIDVTVDPPRILRAGAVEIAADVESRHGDS